MDFRILRASGEELASWRDTLARLPTPLRDLHFTPEYGLIYQRTYGQEPLLAVGVEGECFIIQPFVRRPLNDLPFLAEPGVAEPFYDIANPYGYGGPLCNLPDSPAAPALAAEFDRQFCGYCEEQGFASEFESLHPLLGNQVLVGQAGRVEPIARKQVVIIDLTQGAEGLKSQLNRGHRSSVNKARAAGISIARVSATAENLALFQRLYLATMDRNQAQSRWYFPESYFSNCCELLGDAGSSLFFASLDGKVVSGYLVLHAFDTAYYHFGGSDSEHFALRPNNLLMHESSLWLAAEGYRQYHLGGGVTSNEDDPLFRFKAGFGSGRETLHTYQRVLHQENYDRLCTLKLAHERMTGKMSDSDFFPMYRR